MKLTRHLKQEWAKILLGDFTTHHMALGLAIGTIIALLPTFGFSALLALVVIFLFPHINRPTIFLALIIWNPIVQIPIYLFSFHLGSILFSGMPIVEYDFELLNQLYTFTRRFLVAHVLITLSLSIMTYIGSRFYLQSKLER